MPWIPTGEQSGLWTHTATTGKRFVVRADKKLTAFLELEAAIAAAPNVEEITWPTPEPWAS